MSEEEDGDMVNDVAVNIRLVVPSWRSEELNKFLKELDDLHKKAYPDAISRPRNPVHAIVPLTSELRSRIFAWGIAPFH
ncbi:hypothetical protein G6F61_014712 [Rhizopus arrhizus]|nr:hypothetical protein G6F61_014712 [Rhizopus arrhizus]